MQNFCKKLRKYQRPCGQRKLRQTCRSCGIISNAILCAAKILVGIISGSIAIIADGINNLADASSSVITLAGFKLASMPEDEEHPYGHARIEYISGMIVSVLIVVVGVELIKSSASKILHPSPLEFSWSVVIVLAAAILLKKLAGAFQYQSRKEDSLRCPLPQQVRTAETM